MTHHPDCLSLDNVLGRHDCDCKPKGVHGLMHAQIAVEVEAQKSHYQKRIDLLRKTLMGFASNGTACKACQMSNELATEAIARDDALKHA